MYEALTETRTIWRFCLAALAVWRITHLLAEEDGPWDSIANLRQRLGASIFGRLMDCFYCLSLWVSLPFAVWLSDGWLVLFVHWQALSGATCLFQRMTEKPEPVSNGIEAIGGELPCAVVRSEAH